MKCYCFIPLGCYSQQLPWFTLSLMCCACVLDASSVIALYCWLFMALSCTISPSCQPVICRKRSCSVPGETVSRDAFLLLLHALHVQGTASQLFSCIKWRQSDVHLEKQQLISFE